MRELPPAARLTAFGLGLALVLGGSVWLGQTTGSVAQAEPAAAPVHSDEQAHSPEEGPPAASGTSLSADGLRLEAPTTTIPPLNATRFFFRVLDEDDEPVVDFDLEQGKRMHLVIVSRDLSRSAHTHPEMAPDGTWSKLLTLSPGSYRAVADFSVGGERRSLAVDLVSPGPQEVAPLAPPSTSTTVGDLRVELARDGNRLSFTAFRGSTPVVPEPYLGARGHLVAFRVGDLAYAHVHPSGEDGATTTYEAEVPGPGTYRLLLELQVDGSVRTAPFTLEVKP